MGTTSLPVLVFAVGGIEIHSSVDSVMDKVLDLPEAERRAAILHINKRIAVFHADMEDEQAEKEEVLPDEEYSDTLMDAIFPNRKIYYRGNAIIPNADNTLFTCHKKSFGTKELAQQYIDETYTALTNSINRNG